MIALEAETITSKAKQLIAITEKINSKFPLRFENLKNRKRNKDSRATILNI